MNVKGRIVRRAYRLMVPYRLGLMRDDGLGVGWFLEMKREVNSQKSHKNNKNGNEELSILLSTAAMAGVLVREKVGVLWLPRWSGRE